MADYDKPVLDITTFLATSDMRQKLLRLPPKQPIFEQGEPAESVFFLQKGCAKLTVTSRTGKEATMALLFAGDFIGEEALAAAAGIRLSTATAVTACTVIPISRQEMIRMLQAGPTFEDLFLKFLLKRNMRIQADLVDQMLNSSEKRLARILLLIAGLGQSGELQPVIPKISQETLAEMIGTTRSRVSFFMNRFRKLGFIEYDGRIRVHKSLLTVIQQDEVSEDNARNRIS